MTEAAAAAAMATAVEETEAVQGSSVGSGPVSFLPMPPIASEAREYDAEEEDDSDDAKITAPALMSRTEIHEEGEVTNADGAGDGQITHHCTLHKRPISWR